jgi:hypothetical protein
MALSVTARRCRHWPSRRHWLSRRPSCELRCGGAAVLRCCGAAVLWCCGLHAAGRLLPIRRMNAGHPTLQRRSRSVSNAHLPQGRRFSNLTDGRHVSDLGRIAACRVGTSTSSVSRYSIFISRKADPKGKDEVIRVLVIGKCYSDALVLL